MLPSCARLNSPTSATRSCASADWPDASRAAKFVRTGPQTFKLRQVALGDEQDGYRGIVGGLRDGEEIVLDGAFLLNVERQRQLTQ